MLRQIQLLDVVKLTEDDERHHLRRGDVGTVVEVLAPDVFEVEFTDDDGRTYALAPLHRNQLSQVAQATTASATVSRNRSTRLEEIEGIGPVYATKLRDAGVLSVEGLLKAGGTPNGRKDIAEKAGISETNILEWVNRADLFRVKGIGEEYSDLLEAAGVDSVVELSQRRPDNLHAALVKTNDAKKRVRRVPTETEVAGWIEHAKTLPRAVSH
jgi:predicted flap endonuclease-1-like 5' DNA nuclease